MLSRIINKCECFTIQVSELQDRNRLDFSVLKPLKLFSKPNWLSVLHPRMMQADPFLFVNNDTLYLFFEEMLFERGLGVIKMISTTDLIHWTAPLQITHEPKTHFSYPFIFENNGSIYMMPETGCDHNIRLYRATDNSLSNFVRDKTIVSRDNIDEINSITFDFADSCILHHKEKYYLFTSIYKDNTYYLHLYVSDRFDGNYTQHPCSPIAIGNDTARCGGAIFSIDNILLRPCQDCTKVYGGQLHLRQIKELTPTSYIEEECRNNIIPQEIPFFREGGHHLNIVDFKGKTIIAMDARFTTSFLIERIRYKLWRKTIGRLSKR